MLSLRLDPTTEERLETLAKATGRTKSHYARHAILLYLSDMEDRFIAIQRLEEPSKRVSLDEIESELGLS